MRFRNLILGATLALSACGGIDQGMYDGKEPKMSLKTFFGGTLISTGFYQDAGGEVKARYQAYALPKWNNDEVTVEEHFFVDDGTDFTRIWHMHMVDDVHFVATANDVIGEGQGEIHGFTFRLKYELMAHDGGKTRDVDADDWVYLQPDGSTIVNVMMSKYGFNGGEIIMHSHKAAKGEKLPTGFNTSALAR